MARGSRIAQLVLIILGFLAFAMMFAVLLGDGADVGFTWTCDDQGRCTGATADRSSGFHQAVVLGLLGIGFEVAAVAFGVRGGGPAAGQGAAGTGAAGPGGAQAAPGYPTGPSQPQFGAAAAPYGTGQSSGFGQSTGVGQPANPAQHAAPQGAGFPQTPPGSPAAPPGSPVGQPANPGSGRASVPPAGPPGSAAPSQGGPHPYQSGYGQQGFPPPYGQQQT